MVDPKIPRWKGWGCIGRQTRRPRCQAIIWQNFIRKLHENERNLTGRHVSGTHLDLPMLPLVSILKSDDRLKRGFRRSMAVICVMFQRGGVDSHLFDPLVRIGLQHAQSRVHVDTQQSSYQINGCKTYVPHKHRVNHYDSISFSCIGEI